jgi:hypothetical protein
MMMNLGNFLLMAGDLVLDGISLLILLSVLVLAFTFQVLALILMVSALSWRGGTRPR